MGMLRVTTPYIPTMPHTFPFQPSPTPTKTTEPPSNKSVRLSGIPPLCLPSNMPTAYGVLPNFGLSRDKFA